MENSGSTCHTQLWNNFKELHLNIWYRRITERHCYVKKWVTERNVWHYDTHVKQQQQQNTAYPRIHATIGMYDISIDDINISGNGIHAVR